MNCGTTSSGLTYISLKFQKEKEEKRKILE